MRMKVLIFLARFELDREKVKKKVGGEKNVVFKDVKEGFEVEGNLDLDKIKSLEEVEKIVLLKSDWKEFSFQSVKKDSLEALKEENKMYKIKVKFEDKIPISAKSLYKHINPYLKHEEFVPDEENWNTLLYLEIKKENAKILYRIGISKRKWWEKAVAFKVNMENLNVVLENPSLKEEVSDFLRLCWIFKLPLIIVTKNKEFEKVLKKAREETKGIEEEKLKIKIVEKFPTDGVLVGFSKHAVKNEKDLKEFFKKREKIYLVFGDDKFGLTQEARESMNVSFRLTPEAKKPLRASHALAYILGLYAAEYIG